MISWKFIVFAAVMVSLIYFGFAVTISRHVSGLFLVIVSKALKSGNRMKSSCPKRDWLQQENPRKIIIISISSWKWYFYFVDAEFKYYADVPCLSASLARIVTSVELKTKMKWILVDIANDSIIQKRQVFVCKHSVLLSCSGNLSRRL